LKKYLLFLLFGIAAIFSAERAYAGGPYTYTWTGSTTTGVWNSSFSWSCSPAGGTYPGTSATDIAIINKSSGTLKFTFNNTTALTLNLASIQETGSTEIMSINTTSTGTGTPAVNINVTSVSLGSNTSSLSFLGKGTIAVGSGGISFSNDASFICGSATDSTTTVSLTTATVTCGNNSGGIFNYGTFNVTSSSVTTAAGSQINNESTGTFNVTSSNIFVGKSTAPTTYGLTNSKKFNLTASSIYLNTNPSSMENTPTGVLNMNASAIYITPNNNIEVDNYGTINATTGSNIIAFQAGGSDDKFYNYGTIIAGSGTTSVCTITLAGTRGYLVNTSGTYSSTTYNGTFTLGSGSSIQFDSGCSDCEVQNPTTCASCTFTLASDANSSATIYQIPSSSSCVGNFSVQRYFTGGNTKAATRYVYRNYRIISSAVHNSAQLNSNNVFGLNYIVGATAGLTTTASSTTNIFVTGCTGGSTATGNPSLYLFDETKTPSNASFTSGNFVGVTNISTSSTTGSITTSGGATSYGLPVGTGLLMFDRGAASSWTSRTHSPYMAPESVTLTATGLINQQNIAVKQWKNGSGTLSYTGSGTTGNYKIRGLNLVGNPYPSSINWDLFATSGTTGIVGTAIGKTIWVFNPTTDQYNTYVSGNGGVGKGLDLTTNTGNTKANIIASGQGFFVQASSSSAALTFYETAKTLTQPPSSFLMLDAMPSANTTAASLQYMRLVMRMDSINNDDMLVMFNPAASTKFDMMEDAAYMMGNGAPEHLASFSSDSVMLAINKVPFPNLTPLVIPLSVSATASGQFTFERQEFQSIPKLYNVWLMDKFMADSLDLRANTKYVFNLDVTDTTSFGKNRFSLVIRQNPALMVHLLNFTGTKATGGAQIAWKTENEENYTNFTVQRSADGGKTFAAIDAVTSGSLGSYGFLDTNPPAGPDTYRLQMQDLNGTITYSNVVTLIYGNSSNSGSGNISVYPNPATSQINLVINKTVSVSTSNNLTLQQSLSAIPTGTGSYGIKIISMTGNIITDTSSSATTWQNDISKLLPGTYIIQVINNGDKSVVGSSTFVKI
jgi:trimeric autotransporter adhesin